MFKFFMKKFLILFAILFNQSMFANENISKLNSLYLNGVLDKESYFDSINNLGIDTTNEIFLNLFTLFSDRVLDIESYERSVVNLINLSENKVNDTSTAKESKNKNSKSYLVESCKGDSAICKQFINDKEPLNFKYENGEVYLDSRVLDDLVKSEPSFTSYLPISFNKKANENNFVITATILHIQGVMINFSLKGYLEDNDFYMTKLGMRVNSQELVDATLKEK